MDFNKLTAEEKEKIYREVEHDYAITDAERHLLSVFGFEPCESDLHSKTFEERAGFGLEEALDPESPHYALEFLTESFFHTRDCNIPENVTWECVVNNWFANL